MTIRIFTGDIRLVTVDGEMRKIEDPLEMDSGCMSRLKASFNGHRSVMSKLISAHTYIVIVAFDYRSLSSRLAND